jgi:ElaB/YqjD/DUF883 family membrane-anchored ribosome-binding protein
VNQDDMSSLYEQILRNEDRYSGTEYESKLLLAKSHLQLVRSVFDELNLIENTTIINPEETQNLRERIKQIIAKNKKQFGHTQLKAVMKYQEDLDIREQLEFSKAESWIASLETELSNGKTYEVREKLDRKPTFLTPDLNTRLDKILLRLNEIEA